MAKPTQHQIVQRILRNDASGAKDALAREEVEAALPDWVRRPYVPYVLLMDAISRMNAARETQDRFKILKAQEEGLIAFELVICLGFGQQVADAHFHKSTIYVHWADRCNPTVEPDVQNTYLSAARNCIRKAVSTPQYVQPLFLEVQKGIEIRVSRWPYYRAHLFGFDIYKIPGIRPAPKHLEAKPSGEKYQVYAAESKSLALKFLRGIPTDEIPPLFYIIVETPEGNIGKDMNGMFDEATGKGIQ